METGVKRTLKTCTAENDPISGSLPAPTVDGADLLEPFSDSEMAAMLSDENILDWMEAFDASNNHLTSLDDMLI